MDHRSGTGPTGTGVGSTGISNGTLAHFHPDTVKITASSSVLIIVSVGII